MKRLLTLLALSGLLSVSIMNAQKKISILGDSYSTFKGYVEPDTNLVWYPADKNDVVKVEQTWWYRFLHNYGFRLEKNNSYSGSTICNTGYRKEDYSDRSFITRMDKLGNPDIIFIFGCTNDSWAGSPIGEYKYSDWTQADLYHFRPAMALLLKGIQEFYPNADIYFVLNSELKESINESVYTICKHYEVPVITLYDIDKQRGHPSIAGMKAISEQIHAFLEIEATKGELEDIKKELKDMKKELKEELKDVKEELKETKKLLRKKKK